MLWYMFGLFNLSSSEIIVQHYFFFVSFRKYLSLFFIQSCLEAFLLLKPKYNYFASFSRKNIF